MNRFQLAKHFAIGMLMGIADLIPGVSGGTVAYLTGVHPRLVGGISQASKNLPRGKIKQIDWLFFIPLGVGLVLAILLGSGIILKLLHVAPIVMMAIMTGLLLGAGIQIYPKRAGNQAFIPAVIGAGILLAYLASPIPKFSGNPVSLFFAGILALSAFLLPGISGSGILLTLGLYQTVLTAVHERAIVTLAPFAAGALVGLIGCAKLLERAFARKPIQTKGVLTGIVMASAYATWPWRSDGGFGMGVPSGIQFDVYLLVVAGLLMLFATIPRLAHREKLAD